MSKTSTCSLGPGDTASRAASGDGFDAVLRRASTPQTCPLPSAPPIALAQAPPSPGGEVFPGAAPTKLTLPKTAHSSYLQEAGRTTTSTGSGGWSAYKDDQLLRNPGGDYYDLPGNRTLAPSEKREGFAARVGKDLSDAAGNIKNLVQNLLFGSKVLFRDQNNQIREGRQRGLLRSLGDFFMNMGSALTLGFWNPGGKEAPQGLAARVKHAFSKIREAVLGDLIGGVTGSVNHMGKNLILAGWNLVEVIPDATIGNFDAGRKLTTSIFDNGQVLVEYLTDVVPSGDAWFRVHAGNLGDMKPPLMYNISLPEHYPQDTRWQYVRNTPFRKSIETVGALLADAASFLLIGQTGTGSGKDNNP